MPSPALAHSQARRLAPGRPAGLGLRALALPHHHTTYLRWTHGCLCSRDTVSVLGNALLLAASSGPGPRGCLPRLWGQEGASWVTPHSPHARNILTRGLGNQAGLGSNLGPALLRLWASLYLTLSGKGGSTCTWDGVGVTEALQVKLGEDWSSSSFCSEATLLPPRI